MASLGAKYLCFVSRSGLQSASDTSLVAELEAMGVQARVYQCDVADASQLEQTLATCAAEMRRIRGVLQCAMVLRDGTSSHMTVSQWNEALRPKVEASWNLDPASPGRGDRFLSSCWPRLRGPLAPSARPNYGAGGTVQDALTVARRARGAQGGFPGPGHHQGCRRAGGDGHDGQSQGLGGGLWDSGEAASTTDCCGW